MYGQLIPDFQECVSSEDKIRRDEEEKAKLIARLRGVDPRRSVDHGPGVVEKIQDLKQRTDALAEAVACLSQKLGPVLRPAPPDVCGLSGGIRPATCPLSECLDELHGRIGMLMNHVGDISERLAL